MVSALPPTLMWSVKMIIIEYVVIKMLTDRLNMMFYITDNATCHTVLSFQLLAMSNLKPIFSFLFYKRNINAQG